MEDQKQNNCQYNYKLAQYVSNKYRDKLNSILDDATYNYFRENFRTVNVNKYPKLIERLRLEYSVNECFYDYYKRLFEECIKRGFTTVYDIGSADGSQANVIDYDNLPINYVSVECSDIPQMHNFKSINKEYPFKINADKKTIALSNLCIGLLYITDSKNKKNRAVFEQLLKDFDALMLELREQENTLLLNSIPHEKVEGFSNVYFFDCSKKKTLDGKLQDFLDNNSYQK